MIPLESERHQPRGLFNNEIISAYQVLRREAGSEPIKSLVQEIEKAGPIMVIDPEKAYYDLDDTIERVRIASKGGMAFIEVGGSTNANNEAETVIPQIRKAIEEVEGNTLIISFPGTSNQVVEGIDVTFSLFLPQLDSVYMEKPVIAQYLTGEYFKIINRSRQLDVPIIPVIYILFNGGRKTSVEQVTGISAIPVQNGINMEQVMKIISPWLGPNGLVMLEMGSNPGTSVNLGPVARAVYEKTQVRPIVTGGVSSPEIMAEITRHLHCPVVFGSIAERTPPRLFKKLYRDFRESHLSCHENY